MAWSKNPMRGWLCAWLDEIAKAPPPDDIRGLNFGICEVEEGYRPYLTGARAFDPWDDDWACEEDWVPAGDLRYAPEVIHGADAGRRLGQRHAQTLFAMELRQLVAGGSYEALFHSRGVTTGFDDGPLELLREADADRPG